MAPKKWLGDEKQGRAKRSFLTHPTGRELIERPHPDQESYEIDEVLDINRLCSRKDLFPCFFEYGCEHHESRAIILKVIAGDWNAAVLRPQCVGLKRIGGVII